MKGSRPFGKPVDLCLKMSEMGVTRGLCFFFFAKLMLTHLIFRFATCLYILFVRWTGEISINCADIQMDYCNFFTLRKKSRSKSQKRLLKRSCHKTLAVARGTDPYP